MASICGHDLPTILIVKQRPENGERTAKLSTDLRNVIYAEVLEGDVVKIATLVRRKKALGLVFVEGKICDPDTVQTAETWVSALMSVAYNGKHCWQTYPMQAKDAFHNRRASAQTAQGASESRWWQGKL